MSYVTQLVKAAKDNGLEWEGRATANKLIALLEENGINLPEDESTGFDADMAALQDQFKAIGKLSLKLKGVKDRGVKDRIRAEHERDLNRVKKTATSMKATLAELNDVPNLIKLLKWERSRRIISVVDDYKLNAHEAETIKRRCICYAKTPVAVPAQVDEEYPFTTHYDDERESEMYTVYIKYIKEPEDQIPPALAWDIQNGYKPERKDYPEQKVLWRRHTWRETEFERYFKVLED